MYNLQSEVMNEVSSSDLSRLEEYDSVQDQIVKIEEKVQTTAQQINRYETSITELVLKFPLNLEAIPQFRDKVDTAQAAAEKYEFVEQNIKLSEAMLSQLKETHTKLIKEKNSYAPILEVIKDLTELKEAFGRDGLAQAYITAKFENLISATKENLKKLNVSFEIRQDPDKPLSFQYLRHDTSEAVWLPQTLMSGGQRVRLCLAFIMAVQQVLVYACLNNEKLGQNQPLKVVCTNIS
jgi:DNA repair exonuclease SbcCD ATPase subunit